MLYVIDLESVETRYTKQWKTTLPQYLSDNNITNTVISGPDDIPEGTTPGAFLNFGGTNVYKSAQMEKISRMFCDGTIKNGDYFLYTDAWNPTVIQLKYMASLLDIEIRIGGMWHAGSYDEHDFLGRIVGASRWIRNAEKSMFDCFDDNFFATEFHADMFTKVMFEHSLSHFSGHSKIDVVGWPMDYMKSELSPYQLPTESKEDIILFPHRVSPEKQHDIFKMLELELPQYKFITCQDKNLSKDEYHKLLAKSKMVFSANLQETLGISVYEGALLGAIPVMPDRLSYNEIWHSDYLYPSDWTAHFKRATANVENLKAFIVNIMENYDDYRENLESNIVQSKNYYSGAKIVDHIQQFIV